MNGSNDLESAIYEGWHTYQRLLIAAITPLEESQLGLRAAPELRSVQEIALHILGARARWFYQLMGEGGEAFKSFSRWDRRGARSRSAAELVSGLEQTWQGMQEAISSWSEEDWQQTWPGEYDGEPQIITRPWVLWHLIEHDVHHGGEISLTLGMHGVRALLL